MNLGIFVNTPAQAHFYKNIAKVLEKKGHTIKFLVRDYGETLEVMNGFGLNFFIYSKPSESKIAKITHLPIDILKGSYVFKKYNTELLLGFGGQETYSAFLLRRPSVVFQDSEPHINLSFLLQYKMFIPLTNSIITTKSFTDNLGKKQIKVDSYKEIAYLHPHYFVPDENIFNLLKIDKNEKFVIIRFNAFDAVHDSGMNGFSLDEKKHLIDELKKYAHVFISAEKKVPKDLEKYLLNVPKQKIHDCLYYAHMLITDTQTMTTEAGILGTPVVRCNSFVGPNDMGNFIELEKKYNLIFSIRNTGDATDKAISLIQDKGIKKEWSKRKQKLLHDKIDITAFMVWYIENYPESFKEMKQNPEMQYKFR
jgi:predicted glycosyltransferase